MVGLDTRIFWAGDSTVKENKIDTFPQTGIAQGMQRFFKKEIQLLNLAENGRSTKSFLEEGRFEPVLQHIKKGDYLFLQFGHNDEKADPERHTDAFGSFQENLLYMAEEARKRGAFSLLITPIGRRKFEQGVFCPGSHGEYPEAVRELGQRESIAVADLTSLTEAYLAEAGEQKTEKLFMNLEAGESDNPRFFQGQTDNTHLTQKGAVIMAGFLAEELKRLGTPFAELLCENVYTEIELNG